MPTPSPLLSRCFVAFVRIVPVLFYFRLRFLHPLSPRGKLAYLGLEGLEATGRLVREAILHCSSDGGGGRSEGRPIVLRDEIYRVATSRQQAHVLQKTAEGSGDDARLSRLVEWIPSYGEYGALRLHSGCQVVHVPSYLKGLWRACQARCSSSSDADAAEDELNHRSARWVTVPSSDDGFREALLKQPYDAVVFAAGAGMFVESTEALTSPLLTTVGRLPVQLVRGQSLVMALPSSSDEVANTDLPLLRDAILCGKYVSPLPETGRVLVGATHEFKPTPWTVDTVFDELRSRTEGCLVPEVASSLWNRDRIRQVTQGVRVQSARGKHGRLPIVGRLDPPSGQILHPNAWVFTGLSSRGLLYHAWFGDVLARAILSDSEHVLRAEIADLLWWKSSSSDAS
jgi:glycine/D-amino acid oxidase-like deaminating enzyme